MSGNWEGGVWACLHAWVCDCTLNIHCIRIWKPYTKPSSWPWLNIHICDLLQKVGLTNPFTVTDWTSVLVQALCSCHLQLLSYSARGEGKWDNGMGETLGKCFSHISSKKGPRLWGYYPFLFIFSFSLSAGVTQKLVYKCKFGNTRARKSTDSIYLSFLTCL